MPYLKWYLYTKLGRPIWGRGNLTLVGTHRIQGKYGLSVPLRGRENLTPVGIQGKRGYLCLTANALVVKILLHLEYIEFKANAVIHALPRMPYSA